MRLSLTRRAYDYVFGYDYFLSHRQADGHSYAEKLADALQGQFHCFLDTREFRKGLSWKLQGLRALKKSAVLVLISTPEVYMRLPTQDDPVWDEVDGFLHENSDASIVVIDLANSFIGATPTHRIKTRIGPERLRIAETADITGGPSKDVLEQLRADFRLSTQATKRERVLRTVLSVILSLAIIAGLLYGSGRRKERERIESQAIMLLDRASEQIRSGKSNEAASSLVSSVQLAPKLVAPAARLQSLSREYSGFERSPDVPTESSHGIVWDAVWDPLREKPGFVLGDEKGLRITYGGISKITGRWPLLAPEAEVGHARLSPWDNRLLVWVRDNPRGRGASYRLDAPQERYVFEATLPDGSRDAVFLPDDTLIIGRGTQFIQHRLTSDAQGARWQATSKQWDMASHLRELAKEVQFADSFKESELQSLKLSPSEKLLYIVWSCLIITAERQHNLVFCLDLESGQFLGKTIGTVPADKLFSIDALSPEDRHASSGEKVALVWDDPHRGSNLSSHRGGAVQIYELLGDEFNVANQWSSIEGLNAVAFMDQTFALVGTDASRVRVVYDSEYSSNWFSAVTKGAVQTVIRGNSNEFWLVKAENPLSHASPRTKLTCEHWKVIAGKIATPRVFTDAPPEAGPASSRNPFNNKPDGPFGSWISGSSNVAVQIRKFFFGGTSCQGIDPPTLGADHEDWVAVSADGKYVAVASYRDAVTGADDYVQVWETATNQRVSPPMIHDGPVASGSLSADGQLLATLSANDSPNSNRITHLQVWSVKGGYPLTASWSLADLFENQYPDIHKSQNLPFYIQSLIFSLDGRSLFTSIMPKEEPRPSKPIVYKIAIGPSVNELKSGVFLKDALRIGGLEIKENGVMDFYEEPP